MFGAAINYDAVRIHRRKWWPFQPKRIVMAPDGHIWVHPQSPNWSDDYSQAHLGLQGLFVHEMTHVWQAQRKGKWYLPLRRHPFCRYSYTFDSARPFDRYGIEQQAEIVRHAFLQRHSVRPEGVVELAHLERTLPFTKPMTSGGSSLA